jgi:hypothetical protein
MNRKPGAATVTEVQASGAEVSAPEETQKQFFSSVSSGFQVFVKGLSGTLVIPDVKPEDTISSFIAKVAERSNESKDNLTMSLIGKPLMTHNSSGTIEMTLADYNVQRDSTFEVGLKVRGGL